MWEHGLTVGLALLAQWLDSIIEVFSNLNYCKNSRFIERWWQSSEDSDALDWIFSLDHGWWWDLVVPL